MSKDRLLVVLVAADFFLAMALIAVEGWLHDTLPAPVREYLFAQIGISGSAADLFNLALWGAMVGLSFLSWIGLLTGWRPARPLYAASWVAMILVVASDGPSILTPIGAALNTVETLVGGMILGLVYFSDLARQFEREPVNGTGVGARALPRVS